MEVAMIRTLSSTLAFIAMVTAGTVSPLLAQSSSGIGSKQPSEKIATAQGDPKASGKGAAITSSAIMGVGRGSEGSVEIDRQALDSVIRNMRN
jgi:hypothetical protein